ncbi:MAG: sigma-54-dependent Fis family transcriptional regulator, partial [Nitrospira sp.]|nr:sigma-54-dependent Fis family transcriptional regulator [Nitrospira sp.]
YYRLAVLPLTVPPLRERQEDIPLLVRHFLAKSSARHNRSLPSASPEILKFLVQQPWAGNVRELENLIERLVVTSAGSVIHMEKLVGQGNGGGGLPEKNLKSIGKSARQDAERLRILDALREANGDRTRTARILKISRSSLYNKLRDYQIS